MLKNFRGKLVFMQIEAKSLVITFKQLQRLTSVLQISPNLLSLAPLFALSFQLVVFKMAKEIRYFNNEDEIC